MSTRSWITALTTLSLTAFGTSCDLLVCGDDTIEQDGVCVAANGQKPEEEDSCGEHTHWEDGRCVPTLPPAECDDETTEAVVGDDGVITCVGVVTGGDCRTPITCPTPPPGRMIVCGSLFDLETNVQLEADEDPFRRCDPAAPTADGPCSLQLKYYDALAFATNPDTADVLPTEEDQDGVSYLDGCGRFRATVRPPDLGFLGIAATDADASGNDNWALSGVALPATSGLRVSGFRGYTVRRTTDAKWTESAELAGNSFATRGVYAPIYLHQGQRVAGVTVTRDGSPRPDFDYYFDDDTPDIVSNVDPMQSATGVNGVGLLIMGSLTNYSGTGAEPDGCQWPTQTASVVSGVVFVQQVVAECE